MANIVLLYIPTLVAFLIFIYSIIKAFKGGTSLYTRLLICTVGVFVLSQIYSFVVKEIGNNINTDFSLKYIGIFASFLFVLTYETGTMDKIIDDGSSENKKYRILGFYGPILLSLIILAIIITVLCVSTRNKLLLILLLVFTYGPAIVGIYYIFKHLIMPTYGLEFLKRIKKVETIMFIAYICSPLYYLFLTLGLSNIAKAITGIVMLLFATCLYIAIKGEKAHE